MIKSTPAVNSFLNAACHMCSLLPAGRRTAFSAFLRLAGQPESFELQLPDFRFLVDTHDPRCCHAVLHGIQDPATIAILLAEITPGDLVVDIGANKGLLSLFLAHKAGLNGRVVAYEPDPRNFQDLEHNAAINRDRLNLLAVRKALSSRAGIVHFDQSAWDDGTSGRGRIVNRIESRKTVEVEAATFDDEMDRLGISSAAVVKIDIEGGEVEAVKGMRRSLAAKRLKVVILEFHDFQGNFQIPQEQAEGMLEQFQSTGYRGVFFDQNSFTEQEGRAGMRGEPLPLQDRTESARAYSWEARNALSKGRWLRPLQFLFRAAPPEADQSTNTPPSIG